MENHNKTLSPELAARLAEIKHVALDMDGTVYLGNNLFPFTPGFLSTLDSLGISYSFLTNNPTRSVADYLQKLAGMGIEATEDNMYTTSLAAIDYIKKTHPAAKRLYMLGTPSMVSQFEKAGFVSCEDDPDDVPDVLVVAFDTTLTYPRLCRAASKRMTDAATAAFSDSTLPCMGMRTFSSASAAISSLRPLASLPISSAAGFVQSAAS